MALVRTLSGPGISYIAGPDRISLHAVARDNVLAHTGEVSQCVLHRCGNDAILTGSCIACRETKDKMSWSRARLDQLMQDLEIIVGKESKAHITGLKDLSGEVKPEPLRDRPFSYCLYASFSSAGLCFPSVQVVGPLEHSCLSSSGRQLVTGQVLYYRHT